MIKMVSDLFKRSIEEFLKKIKNFLGETFAFSHICCEVYLFYEKN
jgi:hypothetical protein